MSSTWRGRSYPTGTKVQHRNGYIFVKTEEGKLMAESRRAWELEHGEELQPGDRIFHIDGNRENNKLSNLAKVHYNQTKFVMLKESKILWMPKQNLTDRVLAKAKHLIMKRERQRFANAAA